MKKALYKVPNGKLLKIFLDESRGQIVNIRITGDFFVHPEESIEKLEDALIGSQLEEEFLANKINNFLKLSPTTLFGLDVPSLVSTILTAHKST